MHLSLDDDQALQHFLVLGDRSAQLVGRAVPALTVVALMATNVKTVPSSRNGRAVLVVTLKTTRTNTPNGSNHKDPPPAPGYRERRPRPGGRPSVAAVSSTATTDQQPPQQPQQQPQQRQQTSPSTLTAPSGDIGSILKTWCAAINMPNEDLCMPVVEDAEPLDSTCAPGCQCSADIDISCAPRVRDEEAPALYALQAPEKKKNAMPNMLRPNSAQRRVHPMTTGKIAQIERTARRGEIHLPPCAANCRWGHGGSGTSIVVANHKKLSQERQYAHQKPRELAPQFPMPTDHRPSPQVNSKYMLPLKPVMLAKYVSRMHRSCSPHSPLGELQTQIAG